MNVISRKKLQSFWEKNPDAERRLRDWYTTCRKTRWQNIDETRQIYPHADIVGDCTVFNIGGNKFRLVVKIRYRTQRIYIIKVLTHKDYERDKWKNDC